MLTKNLLGTQYFFVFFVESVFTIPSQNDRITIVFEKLASEYHHMGDREDVNAKLEDLDN